MINQKFNPFSGFPENKIKNVKRTQAAENKIKSFDKVNNYLKVYPMAGLHLDGVLFYEKILISELHKADKNGLYKDQINSLQYINERIYNEMLDKITKNALKKDKEQWEIDIEKDLANIPDDSNNMIYKRFPLKNVSVQRFRKEERLLHKRTFGFSMNCSVNESRI